LSIVSCRSLREAMSGEDRDATLTHIIHELRHYKHRLVRQIDAAASRDHVPRDHAATSVPGDPTTPPPHRPATSPAINGLCKRARKEHLPDLVRSSIPPLTAGPPPRAGPPASTIWNPALSMTRGESYSLDWCGAMDLSTSHVTRPATVTSYHQYPPLPPAVSSDEVSQAGFPANATHAVSNVLKFGLSIFYNILNVKKLSSTGKKTARFLLARACDSYIPYVRSVG